MWRAVVHRFPSGGCSVGLTPRGQSISCDVRETIPSSHRWILLSIVIISLAVRLAVSFSYRSHLSPGDAVSVPRSEAVYIRREYIEIGDSQQYLLLAENLRHYGFFSWDGRTAVTFRTPGYPLLLALLGNSLVLVILVQSLLGALTVLMVFGIGRRWFGERSGLAAAALMAVDLPAIAYTGMVMTETWFVFLVVLAAWLLARGTSGNVVPEPGAISPNPISPVCVLGCGIVLGYAALVRPIALLAALPFVSVLLLTRQWRRALTLAAAFVLLPSVWTARNYVHYRRLSFSSIGGYNLFYYNAAALEADRLGVPFQLGRENLEREFGSGLDGDNPLVLSAQLGHEAVRRIARDPLRYAKVYLRGLGYVAFGIKSDEIVLRIVDQRMRLASAWCVSNRAGIGQAARLVVLVLAGLELLMTLAVFVLAAVALLRLRSRWVHFAMVVAAYFVLVAAPLPDGRFRTPAMPFLYLSAAALMWRSEVQRA